MMSALTKAIIEHDNTAKKIAATMGQNALPELLTLLEDDNPAIRERCVFAMSALPLTTSYPLLVKAAEDSYLTVALAAINEIEKRHREISTELLVGLLEKLKRSKTKNPIVLVLGERLTLNETQHLDKYCNTEHEQSLVLHCITALAKMGVEQRRQQFSTYLCSLHDKPQALLTLFELVEYINQPWVAPSLRLLLSNTQPVQKLSTKLPGYPTSVRVCDKVAVLLCKLLTLNFDFVTPKHKNYTSEQLEQINVATVQYKY